MRMAGLDIGTKTIGVAISDELGWTAQPHSTLRFQDRDEAIKKLHLLLKQEDVTDVVVGLPLNMDGTEGTQVQFVKEWIEKFTRYGEARNTRRVFHFWDERLSTVAAERVLLEADLSRQKRKEVIDKMAAVHILQGFLDSLIP